MHGQGAWEQELSLPSKRLLTRESQHLASHSQRSWPYLVLRTVILRCGTQLILTGSKSTGSLTHIVNKEGVCLRIHLDVSKTFQGLSIGNVVMLHGSTGSIFGWVPRDFQAHFSGQQFHVPWLQWVVNYANSATINLR